jgi:DNA-binding IclR family transcriptional regulator
VRSGDDALCVDAHFGAFMVPTLTAGIGGCIPLGLGPGSQAILAALPDAEVRAILERNAARLTIAGGPDVEEGMRRVRATRAAGFAFDPGELLPEIRGLAITLARHDRPVTMTVSIACLASRLPEDRVAAVVEILRRAARRAFGDEPAGAD